MRCLPALPTCSELQNAGLGTNLSSIPEVCNGKDDNCDGTIDEGLDCSEQKTFCEECNYNNCNKDRVCTTIPNEEGLFCMLKAESTGGIPSCPSGQTLLDGYCVPANNRCSATTTEMCDGYDNDEDGLVDENNAKGQRICPYSSICQFDAHCKTNEICVQNRCASECTTNSNCPRGKYCLTAVNLYGKPRADVCLTSSQTYSLTTENEAPLSNAACKIHCSVGVTGVLQKTTSSCLQSSQTCTDALECLEDSTLSR
jgi:hypothetical protein